MVTSPRTQSTIATAVSRPSPRLSEPRRVALTETEPKMAALLAEGLSNPDIAARMFTSRRTVQYHVSNILAKLGLSSRLELATLVARRVG